MSYNYLSTDANASPSIEPTFETGEFKDQLFDEDGKGHMATFKYEGHWNHREEKFMIEEMTVTCAKVFDKEDVIETVSFYEGRSILIDCKIIWN